MSIYAKISQQFGSRYNSRVHQPRPAKIEKILNYKVATTANEVRSFWGLIGYYRRFVPNFRSIAKPLTLKTHKDLAKKKIYFDRRRPKSI